MFQLAFARDVSRSRIWPVLVHSMRTAVAVVASLTVARFFSLPETYWAPITTIVITQSSLGAAFDVSTKRFFGTALGAAVAAIVTTYLGHTLFLFAASILALGLLCAAVRLDRSAYRFGGIALSIVMLVPRLAPAWQVAFHRFVEVSIGIGVALLLTLVWPETEDK